MNPPTTTLLLLLSRYTFEYAGPAPEMTDYNVTTRWVGGAEEGEGGGGGGRARGRGDQEMADCFATTWERGGAGAGGGAKEGGEMADCNMSTSQHGGGRPLGREGQGQGGGWQRESRGEGGEVVGGGAKAEGSRGPAGLSRANVPCEPAALPFPPCAGSRHGT